MEMRQTEKEVLIQAVNVCKYFKVSGGRVLHAVEDVNITIHKGETLGLVGESGCGKSTLGRTLMGIYTPTKGQLLYRGKEKDLRNKKERFQFAKKAQIVFQDPYASLDPRRTVGSIIEEGMVIHNMYDPARRKERVAELLDIVGLNREHANRFPHEADSGSVSALPGLWPLSRSLSSVTSQYQLWMYPFRLRSSTCSTICSGGWD